MLVHFFLILPDELIIFVHQIQQPIRILQISQKNKPFLYLYIFF